MPATAARTTTAARVAYGMRKTVIPSSDSALTRAQPTNTPISRPRTVPCTAMMTDSQRIDERSCDRVMPTARSSPSSRVPSTMDRARVFAMPSSAMRIASPSSA